MDAFPNLAEMMLELVEGFLHNQITQECLLFTTGFLISTRSLMNSDLPEGNMICDGDVRIEWRRDRKYGCLAVSPNGTHHYMYWEDDDFHIVGRRPTPKDLTEKLQWLLK